MIVRVFDFEPMIEPMNQAIFQEPNNTLIFFFFIIHSKLCHFAVKLTPFNVQIPSQCSTSHQQPPTLATATLPTSRHPKSHPRLTPTPTATPTPLSPLPFHLDDFKFLIFQIRDFKSLN